jgi:hypothetical protein
MIPNITHIQARCIPVAPLLVFIAQCLDARVAASALGDPPRLPENLAPRATASANSEHNAHYRAAFAIDGRLPGGGGQDDLDQAWCVLGDTHRNGATLSLTWPEPVTIAEAVYYGRTAWFAEENWKDYELYLDDAAQPAARGTFRQGDGPQRVRLPAPTQARKLTFKFRSSYGGLNPGVSELQVFATSPADAALSRFIPLPAGRPDLRLHTPIVESPELKSQLAAGKLGFNRLVLIQRHELNPTHVYTYHVEGFQPGGGLYVCDVASSARNDAANPALRQLIASPQGQILDCDVSFDGREILFSWRRTQTEGYQVFRLDADGSNLRQLTEGSHHNYNACWLPDGGIAFLSTRSARFAYCWISPVGLLHRMDRDGANVRRLSANIVNDFTPSVLNDGRIIYSRWEYVDKPAIPIQSLWTLHPDGTGLAGFFGNRVLSPATFMEARAIPGSTRVLCVLTSHNGPARGAIGLIDHARGLNAQDALRNLTPEVAIGRIDRGDGNNVRGPYESPYPLDTEFFLVSKAGTLLVRDYPGDRQAVVLPPLDGLGFYSARPLHPRTKPPVLESTLSLPAPLEAAARPAVPATPQVQPAGSDGPQTESTPAWATVVLQDVNRGLAPHVQPDEVRQICVVQEMEKNVRVALEQRAFDFQFPVISCGATYAGKKVWGYATVRPDGSACFKVPAGVPIYFLALDRHGRAVQRMRTFTHLMPGEVQGCVGCHEPRAHTTGSRRALASHLDPEDLQPPDWGRGVGFDYAAVVQPVLDRHCVRCHDGPNPPRKVDLSADKTDLFNVSYETLARGRKGNAFISWDSPYVNWIPTYNGHEANILQVTPKAWGSPRSRLADLLLEGHPDTNGLPRIQVPAAELRRVFAWIDLNVPYYGTSETERPNAKGCRQVYPATLDTVLADVAQRRCAGCHDKGQIPRQFWTRIGNPQLNSFLRAPLAQPSGGVAACSKPTFLSTDDPDYQAILKTFESATRDLTLNPRMDMAGALPAAVDRSCLGKLD